jgi:hypothetical protein
MFQAAPDSFMKGTVRVVSGQQYFVAINFRQGR